MNGTAASEGQAEQRQRVRAAAERGQRLSATKPTRALAEGTARARENGVEYEKHMWYGAYMTVDPLRAGC